MQDAFNYILNTYLEAKEKKIKEHVTAKYIRRNAVENICGKASIDTNKYLVKGSPGEGRWADVPWIALFDKDITEKATKGYDIVYLFCSDMSGVYLSLNQGWTYFKEKYGTKDGREKIKLVSNAWKKVLSSTLKDFSFKAIDLKSDSKNPGLPKGYELGHICGKFYEAGKIPDDLELVEDLRNLMGVYRELKGNLKENSIEKTNNHLIFNQEMGLIHDKNDKENLNGIENIIENSLLIEEDLPQDFSNKKDTKSMFNSGKIDFEKKARNQKRLGLLGELMVLKYEKEKLILSKKKKLAEQVRHVSKEDGDGAGYDILSFEADGKPKYIEVKTTTGCNSTPFMITANELKFAELNYNNYHLYRIFDFNKENYTGKLFILNGDISKNLNLKPQQYVVSGILNSERGNRFNIE